MVFAKETTSNLYGFYRGMEKCRNVILDDIEGIPFVHNTNGQWPSYVLGGEIPDEGQFGRIASAMDEGKCPAFWIRQSAGDELFEKNAARYGIRQINYWQGMGLFLNNPLDLTPGGTFPDPEPVGSAPDLKEWTNLINNEVLSGKKIGEQLFTDLLSSDNYRFFKVSGAGKPVSTLLVYHDDEVAGIYMVATRKDMRGRGYGRWITTRVINHFFNQGIRKFVLHATTAGSPLYKSMGFSENVKYNIYWKVGKL